MAKVLCCFGRRPLLRSGTCWGRSATRPGKTLVSLAHAGYTVRIRARYRDTADVWYLSWADLRHIPSKGTGLGDLRFGPTTHRILEPGDSKRLVRTKPSGASHEKWLILPFRKTQQVRTKPVRSGEAQPKRSRACSQGQQENPLVFEKFAAVMAISRGYPVCGDSRKTMGF